MTPRSTNCFLLSLCISLFALSLCSVDQLVKSTEVPILSQYKPIAIDESVKVLKPGDVSPSYQDFIHSNRPPSTAATTTTTTLANKHSDIKWDSTSKLNPMSKWDSSSELDEKVTKWDSTSKLDLEQDTIHGDKSIEYRMPNLRDILSIREQAEIEHIRNGHPDHPPSLPHQTRLDSDYIRTSNLDDGSSLNDYYYKQSQNLYKQRKAHEAQTNSSSDLTKKVLTLPKSDSVKVTQLITGKVPPTFITNEIVEPNMTVANDSKVLARYNVLIPIFLPALKPIKKLNHTDGKHRLYADERLVTETHEELVPMKVPAINNVYKAERVPQKVVTDFVVPRGFTLPPKVNDKVDTANERLVKHVVTRA